ncbi:NAD(P)/FAD-dependent oxidoreductase [Bradyrhizobium jicamae]|uniref:flavin-containing monooxygenase n=1 Tax=Bradyrhizobium jicamae TaxID=280332 RepID=UPI001BAA4B3C|nr:NAD(P)/FAD-dependent oxidoreductase [Bradyrhizobium jicamae]MBR0939207.1 NAD(P)/FAD-dependent oxidoreductase [Bradyrhizobium jicamae]
MSNLEKLETRIQKDLDIIRSPDRSWVRASYAPNGDKAIDVLIVGAGQCGLGLGFGLMREQIGNIMLVERALSGFGQGPWRAFARMRTLRSPKHFNGPDLDIPSLSFQAWYEAQFGEEAWNELGKIPKELWNDYLTWFGQVTRLPIRYGVEVTSIEPDAGGLVTATLSSAEGIETVHARKIVLATGADGNGDWLVPPLVARSLPRPRYYISTDDIPFADFAQKSVAVLGGGASAFDNASVALEAGALSVSILVKRPELHRVNPHKWTEFSGFLNHFRDLPDRDKWRIMNYILPMREPVPPETFDRATAHRNLEMRFGVEVRALRHAGSKIEIETTTDTLHVDELIVCTGTRTDLRARRELAGIVDEIALWSDRLGDIQANDPHSLGDFPYLGPHFEFVEKVPGAAPHLRNIYNLTSGATLSHGPSGASINGLKAAIRRIVDGIRRDFFVVDAAAFQDELLSYAIPELDREFA